MIRLVAEKKDAIEGLCRQFRVRRLELFGSAAGDDIHPDSSVLDFLVEFQELQEIERADTYFGLPEEPRELLENARRQTSNLQNFRQPQCPSRPRTHARVRRQVSPAQVVAGAALPRPRPGMHLGVHVGCCRPHDRWWPEGRRMNQRNDEQAIGRLVMDLEEIAESLDRRIPKTDACGGRS